MATRNDTIAVRKAIKAQDFRAAQNLIENTVDEPGGNWHHRMQKELDEAFAYAKRKAMQALPPKNVMVMENNHQVQITPPNNVLETIAKVAMDPSVPIDRLEALMNLQERFEDREAQKAYSEALAAAKAEIKPVAVNKRNLHTRSSYANLEAIDKEISPILAKHGLSLSFTPAMAQNDGHYGIKCTVRHIAGYSEEHYAEIPIDGGGMKGNKNKTPTQAFGSTMSYGRRYLKCMIVDVATEDDTDGNIPGEPISDEQLKEIQDLLAERKKDVVKFCNYFKVESLKAITTDRFDLALETIRDAK